MVHETRKDEKNLNEDVSLQKYIKKERKRRFSIEFLLAHQLLSPLVDFKGDTMKQRLNIFSTLWKIAQNLSNENAFVLVSK